MDVSLWPVFLIHWNNCVKEQFRNFIAAFLQNILILKTLCQKIPAISEELICLLSLGSYNKRRVSL